MKKKPSESERTNAVIYCRVSTDEQVDNLSLSTQQERSRAYCSVNGWTVVETFKDEGRSAKTTDRDDFQKLLKFCKEAKNRVGFVVVNDLSRFSRNMNDQILTMTALMGAGVRLRSVSENIDETSTGRLMSNMFGAFNQFDNDRKSERTIIGMRKAASLGIFPFKAPLGYLNVIGHAAKKLIPDPKSSTFIQKAFELASTGLHSKSDILRTLTKLGLKTAKGSALSPQTFHKLLMNPIYAGWVVIPRWGVKERGSFEALVAQERFDKVQDVLSGKSVSVTAHLRNNPDFPLRVFVRCEKCCEPLTGSWSKGRSGQRYAYYRCRKRACLAVKITREALEAKFVRMLESLTPDATLLPVFKATVRSTWKQRQGDADALCAVAEQKLTIAKTRNDKLVDLLLDGRIDQPTYDQKHASLNAEIDSIEGELRIAEFEYLDLEGVLRFAEKIITRPARLWLDSSLDGKQRLQKVFFPEGIAFDGQQFGTATTSLFFNILERISGQNNSLASPTGFEPVLSP